ncbi:MAG: hypothetical protein H6Q00_1007 [Holophagaceae bacterium]|nr:hypothetical protein [Holophagaceae bacterium]
MFKNRAWMGIAAIPALIIGCDSKPEDKVPATAPAPVKEPYQVLKHLQYIGVRKDLKAVSAIIPADLDKFYGNICWMHQHAGAAGASLSAQEIQAFGLEDLQKQAYLTPDVSSKDLKALMDKIQSGQGGEIPASMQSCNPDRLDQLPQEKFPDGKPNPDYAVVKAKSSAVMQAGLYRLIKGVPASLWPQVVMGEAKAVPTNPGWQSVTLKAGDKEIILLTLAQKGDGTYGILYWQYKVGLGSLRKMAPEQK